MKTGYYWAKCDLGVYGKPWLLIRIYDDPCKTDINNQSVEVQLDKSLESIKDFSGFIYIPDPNEQ